MREPAVLCDTFVPPVRSETEDPRLRSFFERPASALGVHELLDGDALRTAMGGLGADFARLDTRERARRVLQASAAGGTAALTLRRLRSAALALFYGLVDDSGRNPNWDAIGYPGPATLPPSPLEAPKTIPVLDVPPGETVLEADVCVAGSGAGGSVVAARLQEAGHSVVVLEQGGYRNEADFRQLELAAAQELYLGGGPVWSESGSIGLLAGATLGGGTVVNSLVCLRPPAEVLAEWAQRGLEGVDGAEFEACMDRVWQRLGVNTEATVPNASNRLMAKALERTGRAWELLPRNAGPHDPALCGYCNGGCQQGHKNSTLKTYLQDAADAGARFVVDCRVDRIVVERGRAAGVLATIRHQDGARGELTVRAPLVVVAGGGIESPALLLRSGIGGPAVGSFLRLHPAWFVSGVYTERLESWTGQIQSVVSFDFARLPDGGGFLAECVTLSPTFWAASMPWLDGERHKREMLKLPRVASWHAVSQDQGWGRVDVSADGAPLVRWHLSDERDRRTAARAHVELARLHEAVGAEEIYAFDPPGATWRRGQDFDTFLRRLESFDWRDAIAYSAHQMCSCRMGADRETAVANGDGELHDVRGVWIGDASALPTTPGVNPMISIMALAERTTARILARA